MHTPMHTEAFAFDRDKVNLVSDGAGPDAEVIYSPLRGEWLVIPEGGTTIRTAARIAKITCDGPFPIEQIDFLAADLSPEAYLVVDADEFDEWPDRDNWDVVWVSDEPE